MFTNKEEFKKHYSDKMELMIGKSIAEASINDKYQILATIVREIINKKCAKTNEYYLDKNEKQVFYLSLEFLLGKLLGLYLVYLDIKDICEEGLMDLGIDLKDLVDEEPEAGLGNGGLGRLAACFLDSMSSLGIPGHGCGIRYKYGLFKQKIVEGYQVELPDNWLRNDNVWEIKKPDKAIKVNFGGNVREELIDGKMEFILENYETVLAVPYDIPGLGFRSNNVNTLRLWSAEPVDMEFDFKSFSSGHYSKALEYKNQVEAISEVLYPDDSNSENKILRLKQEYFLVSAGVQSIIRRFKKENTDLHTLPDKVAIHINDTHPALAIPELMRILMDEENLSWDEAWSITSRTISYTNHTIMPEALEKWSIDIMSTLLPRIYMIIYEINEVFCRGLWNKYPYDWKRIAGMAIISEGYVKMGHLAIVGSYSINGVAEIHTDILKKDLLKNFYEDTPFKFNNKTNGITHRRWLIKANPPLTKIITEAIGDSWMYHPADLENLAKNLYDHDPAFQNKFLEAKVKGKLDLAKYIKDTTSIVVDTNSIFDVQVKRIHAYKRQLLNALQILHLYNTIKDNPQMDFTPRTFIFAGKAAPSYYYAKKIIKLITSIADIINNDIFIKNKIKVVFLENYSVSMAEQIFPASDFSLQISTATKEASGTGNMKFMINGAVTIGTLDGANIEIRNEVGDDNIITFGLTVDEVLNYYTIGGYHSYDYYNNDARIKRVCDQLISGFFSKSPSDEFLDLYKSLLDYNDEYFILKDFVSFDDARSKGEKLFNNKSKWLEMCINNLAHAGKFGSDETILKYAVDIWNVKKSLIKNDL
jgi:glycogen phosphorylase